MPQQRETGTKNRIPSNELYEAKWYQKIIILLFLTCKVHIYYHAGQV